MLTFIQSPSAWRTTKRAAFLFFLASILSQMAAGQDFAWAASMGGTDGDGGNALAVDASGNVYVAGHFSGTADFDPGAGTSNLSSAGSEDIFVSKMDASGNLIWAKNMGGTGQDRGYALAVDASGNVHVAGFFSGTADFDPGAGTSNLSSAGNYDVFVSKLDASGNLLWAKSMGGTSSETSNALAVDASGNVYVAGFFSGTTDFDPGAGTSNLASAGNEDVFVSKLDASGNLLWAKNMGGTNSDQATALVMDASGNPHVAGYFNGTADFDPSAGTSNLSSAGGEDIFVSKLDASGSLLWAKSMGGTGSERARRVALDASGNVFTMGFFATTVDLDPSGSVYNLSPTGPGGEAFVSKLDASGNFVWAKSTSSSIVAQPYALATDPSGNVYFSGFVVGTTDFDPGTGTASLSSGYTATIFIAKWDDAGDYLWAVATSGDASPVPLGIAVDALGNVYATGIFYNTGDFDPGTSTSNLTSAGSGDAFTLKLTQPCTAPTAYALTGGGSYCAGGTGMAVGLSGSESGANYQLKIGGTNTGSTVTGTGAAISFGNQTAVGEYTVVAARTTGGCTTTMTGSASVAIRTPTTEITGDEIDEDCDGLETCYKDTDDDGYRPNASSSVASADEDCSDTGEALATDPTGDCADADAARFPSNTESCDGKDNDCVNGMPYTEADADADGYRVCENDCDDTDAARNPGATETVCNQLDDDCDGATDEGSDATPPAIACKTSIQIALPGGVGTASATQLDNGSADACSGTSLSLSIISGQTAYACGSIVGGPFTLVMQAEDAAGNTSTCATSVSAFDVLTYTESTQKYASDGLAGDKLGSATALDGTLAAAGSPEAKINGQQKRGAAYLFNGAAAWAQFKKLLVSDGAAGDYFGNALALDGTTILAGNYGDNIGTAYDRGSALIFKQDYPTAGAWGQFKQLFASDGAAYDYFGHAAALKNGIALVGANKAKIGSNAAQGAAYIFGQNTGGADNWGQVKKLTASDGSANNVFGHALSLNADADHALVGACGNASNRGAAYVFGKNTGGADNWGQVKKLTASDGATGDWFGASASLSSDYALIGAPSKSSYTGAAYIFGKNTGGSDNWGQVKKLSAADGAAGARFGSSVVLAGDYAFVGATQADGKGAVYVFHKNHGGADNWGQISKLAAADGLAGDQFGASLAASGTNAVFGANWDDYASPVRLEQGAMYVFGGAYSCGGSIGPGSEERNVEFIENQADVRCQPNPFADKLHLEFGEKLAAQLLVSDAAGRLMARCDLPAGQGQLDLDTAGWQPGAYFIKVSTEAGARTALAVLARK